jgi:hypothetical protein
MENIIDLKRLLHKVDALIDTMHFVKAEVGLSPEKEHIITCLKYQGVNQMRKQFLRRLVNSIVKYVFSNAKISERFTELVNREELDQGDAHAEIFQQARQYFRTSDIKGQFSELLLFNFLQYYYEAIPVVRKMVITSNPQVERHGADAIHLANSEDSGYTVYLGEAKTYPSGFQLAFKNAIKSIITAYKDHRDELQLYKYEEFLEPEVRDLMKDYLNLKIDIPVKLVVIISYCTGTVTERQSMEENHLDFIQHVLKECSRIKERHYRDENGISINDGLLKELNYILFPVNELQNLLDDFKTQLGLS